jgi:hypothetical protein
MKKILLISLCFIICAGCNEEAANMLEAPGKFITEVKTGCHNARRNIRSALGLDPKIRNSLKLNAYGPGIHSNRYGQPVTLRPDFGGVQGEYLKIKPNAYGLGVHSDQYGRPVREYRWP